MTTTTWANDYGTQKEIVDDVEIRLAKSEKTLPIAIDADTPTLAQSTLLTAWQDVHDTITPPAGAKIHVLNGGIVQDTLQHTSLDSNEEHDNDFLSLQYQSEQTYKFLGKAVVPAEGYTQANPFYLSWDAAEVEGFKGLEVFAYIGSTNNTAVLDANFQFNALNAYSHNTQKIAFGDTSLIAARAISNLDMANTLVAPGRLYFNPIYSFIHFFIPYGIEGMVDRELNLVGVGSYTTVHQQAAPAYTNNYATFGDFGFEIETQDPITRVGMSTSLLSLTPYCTIEAYAVKPSIISPIRSINVVS